jgi:hypothetical protein
MKNLSRGLMVLVVASAVWMASARTAHAQFVYYQPAPVVAVAPVVTSYYYAPAPVMTYYAPAPAVTTYYAPAPVPVVTSYYAAPAVTTYRYGPLGHLRRVSSYYPAPVVTRYGYYYP